MIRLVLTCDCEADLVLLREPDDLGYPLVGYCDACGFLTVQYDPVSPTGAEVTQAASAPFSFPA